MKIIDRTPFISENGEVSFTNQILAIWKFGYGWISEIKSQQIIMNELNRAITKGYTLLRNIPLPDSEITIPLILVGPGGVYVIVTSNLKGNYFAKGDNWGMFEGGKNKAAPSNLLVLTSMTARAVQRYLKKKGVEIPTVDSVLMAANPGMFINCVRPIIRVVMRDGIENFVGSINNSIPIINPGVLQKIIDLLSGPQPDPKSATPDADPFLVAGDPVVQGDESFGSSPDLNELLPWSGDNLGFHFEEDAAQEFEKPLSSEPELNIESSPSQPLPQPAKKLFLFNKKQWMLLIAFGVVEVIILVIFFFLIFINS
jgi:hypothetical protein